MRVLTRTCWSFILVGIVILHAGSIKIKNDAVQKVLMQYDVSPGPFWNSFLVSSPEKAREVCDNLAGKPLQTSTCFLVQSKKVHEETRKRSVECLKNRIEGPGGIYAKMCTLCAAPYLDGIAWAARDRAGLRCTARYISLNRFVKAINEADDLIVPQIKAAVHFIKEAQHQFGSLDDALGKGMLESEHYENLRKAKYERVADIDDDSKISRREMEAYLQAIYVVASDVPEVFAEGFTNKSIRSFRQKWMHAYDWLRFMPSDPGGSVPPQPSPPSEETEQFVPSLPLSARHLYATPQYSHLPQSYWDIILGRFKRPGNWGLQTGKRTYPYKIPRHWSFGPN